jgi:uncharacterized coiled-coil DUF342 family protein
MSKRDAYQQKLEAKIEGFAAEIAQLKAKADEAEADTKLQMYEEIETIREKQDALRKHLDDLREAGDGAWEEVKAGVELAWQDLNDALKRAADRF